MNAWDIYILLSLKGLDRQKLHLEQTKNLRIHQQKLQSAYCSATSETFAIGIL